MGKENRISPSAQIWVRTKYLFFNIKVIDTAFYTHIQITATICFYTGYIFPAISYGKFFTIIAMYIKLLCGFPCESCDIYFLFHLGCRLV